MQQFQTFRSKRGAPTRLDARDVAAGPVEARDETELTGSVPLWKTIGIVVVAAFAARAGGAAGGGNHGHLAAHQIGRQRRQLIDFDRPPSCIDRDVLAFVISRLRSSPDGSGHEVRLVRPADVLLSNPITGIAGCCARAASGHGGCRAADSAMNSRRLIRSPRRRARAGVGAIVRPSALAVLRLITSSNLVGCSTGMSAGFTPLRILSK